MPRGAPPRSSLSLTALLVVSMRAMVPVTLLAVQTPSSDAAIASTPGSTGIWRGSARRVGSTRHTEPLKLSVNQTPPAPTASAPSDRPGTRTPAAIRPSRGSRRTRFSARGRRGGGSISTQTWPSPAATRTAERPRTASTSPETGSIRCSRPVRPIAHTPPAPAATSCGGARVGMPARGVSGWEAIGAPEAASSRSIRAGGGTDRRLLPPVTSHAASSPAAMSSGIASRGLGPHDVRAQIHARHRVLVRVHGPDRARADRDRRRRRAHRRPPDDLGRARVDRDDGARRHLDRARGGRIRVAAGAERDDERDGGHDDADADGDGGDHVPPAPGRGRRRLRQRVGGAQLGVLGEHRLLEPPQRGPRLDPQLPDQALARVAVGGQRLGLAARPVQREHLLGVQPLPQRVLGGERLELHDDLVVAAEEEIGVDPVLERDEPGLVQARRLVRQRAMAGQVAERRTAPERQRLAQDGVRPLGVPGRERDRAPLGQRREPLGVALAGHDVQDVAAVARDERVADRAPDARDEVVQAARGRRRRRVLPQRIDQAVAGDDLIGVRQQHGKEEALAPLGQCHGARAVLDLQWTENLIAHFFLARPTVPAAVRAVA